MLNLLSHQEETVKFGLAHKYAIYGLGPGLGKTVCALETYNRLSDTKRLLVICPSYLIQNWSREISKFYGDKFIVTLFKSGKDLYFPVDSDIVITSYDLGQKADYLFAWAQMVVFDEVHFLKEMSNKRTQFYHKNVFENSIPRVLLLSGTVIKNRIYELYSPLALCHYQFDNSQFLRQFPSQAHFADFFSFKSEFNLPVKNRFIKLVRWKGLKNKEILRFHLKKFYVRFETEEVLRLEPIIVEEVNVLEKMDEALLKEFETWKETGSVKPERKAQVALEKAEFTAKIARDKFEAGFGPIAIYTDHRASCAKIAELLKCDMITGETPKEKRSKIAEAFQAGDKDFIVATIGSFSTGVTLTASRFMIFNDYPWVPGDLEQALYRIRRIGQDKQCYVLYVLGSEQDNHILKTIAEKANVIKKVTT